MAFQSVTNNSPIVKPKLLNEGDKITGYYTGEWASKEYPDSKSIVLKLAEPLKTLISVKDGDKYVEKETVIPAGDEIKLSAAGNLKYFLTDQPKGYLYQFVYKGMHELTSGKAAGKMSHKFEILKDDSKTIDSQDTAQDDLPF